MNGQPSVWRRAQVLADLAWTKDRARIDRILCEQEGIDPEEFAQDCANLNARCKRAGVTTVREREAFIAAELGVSVDELAAEAQEIADRAMAIWRAGR